MCVHTDVHACACMCMCVCAHMCVHVCVCVLVCVCAHLCVYNALFTGRVKSPEESVHMSDINTKQRA